MEKTILKNPYQAYLNTEITRRKIDGDCTHLYTADTIFYDAKRYNLPFEKGEISGRELLDTYTNGKELIHIIKGQPSSSKLTMTLCASKRMDIQRQCSARYLIDGILSTFYNRKCYGFKTDEKESVAYVEGHYSDLEIENMKRRIERLCKLWIGMGMDIRSGVVNGSEMTRIAGLYYGPYLGPHLANTAEIHGVELLELAEEDGRYRIRFRTLPLR